MAALTLLFCQRLVQWSRLKVQLSQHLVDTAVQHYCLHFSFAIYHPVAQKRLACF